MIVMTVDESCQIESGKQDNVVCGLSTLFTWAISTGKNCLQYHRSDLCYTNHSVILCRIALILNEELTTSAIKSGEHKQSFC